MDRWKREGLRSGNRGLRNQIDYILDAYERQQAHRADVQKKLDALRVKAGSSDQLAEVTVDSAGVVTEVRLSAAAMRGTPEQLGRSITEAAQEAARLAWSQREEVSAPITEAAEALPDLPDMVPGAPSWRDSRESIDDNGQSQALLDTDNH
ncbi:YbaB/EbfC family nucleoid-associated protein [Nocardia sp. NBC_00881]|uniref:YbaB/EbfC family nucleoid-associated protein n=1 Tax=Nocardia sp. NBC_00881 TaxID=2975995 RepID=UPI00386BBF00|nr:YbaB/EbfC family nucleoid-associated protein [Nocardia sp. NBC_00881]